MAKQVTSQKDITFVWNEIDPTNGFCRNVDDTLTLENEMLNSENLHNLLCFFLFLFGNELKATPPSCLVPC